MSLLLWSAILAIACDQTLKACVIRHLSEGQSISFSRIAIRRVTNRSVFRGPWSKQVNLWLVWAIEFALVAGLVQFGGIAHSDTAEAAFGLAIGGAGSNLLDQALRHGVVDFIDVGFWPVFNTADAAIATGVLVGLAAVM